MLKFLDFLGELIVNGESTLELNCLSELTKGDIELKSFCAKEVLCKVGSNTDNSNTISILEGAISIDILNRIINIKEVPFIKDECNVEFKELIGSFKILNCIGKKESYKEISLNETNEMYLKAIGKISEYSYEYIMNSSEKLLERKKVKNIKEKAFDSFYERLVSSFNNGCNGSTKDTFDYYIDEQKCFLQKTNNKIIEELKRSIYDGTGDLYLYVKTAYEIELSKVEEIGRVFEASYTLANKNALIDKSSKYYKKESNRRKYANQRSYFEYHGYSDRAIW